MTKKNTKKRLVAMLGVCALAGSMGIGGMSLAYLTDGETVANTFTVGGDIGIELLEEDYPGNDSTDVKDLVPNEEVLKDPKVVNTGTNDAVVFMVVDSPMEALTVINDDGTPVNTQQKTEGGAVTTVPQRKDEEIFWFKDGSDDISRHQNHFDESWTALESKSMYVVIDKNGQEKRVVFAENGAEAADLDDTEATEDLFDGAENVFRTDVDAANKLTKRQKALQQLYASLPAGSRLVRRHVFAYQTDIQGSTENDADKVRTSARLGDAVDEHQTTRLFDKVQMKNFIENEIGGTTQTIGVRAYAIQADKILENAEDLSEDLTKVSNLNKIYDIFIAQNSTSSDKSGLKVIDLREADAVEEDHVNRWNTETDVTSPNNVRP